MSNAQFLILAATLLCLVVAIRPEILLPPVLLVRWLYAQLRPSYTIGVNLLKTDSKFEVGGKLRFSGEENLYRDPVRVVDSNKERFEIEDPWERVRRTGSLWSRGELGPDTNLYRVSSQQVVRRWFWQQERRS